ncbi:response regulator [bacterium]|nr:response regulator [bacterium]
MKILIVDDKDENLLLLNTLLKGIGHDVEQAENGKKALEKLKKNTFEMIISDILMPVMDGYELCQACKKDPELKNIVFVFYTATYTEKNDEIYAMQLGADKFLIKPMEPKAFLSAITELAKKVEQHKIIVKKPEIADAEAIKMHRDRLLNKLSKKIEELQSEIERRKKAEEQVQKDLMEKEILLRELYHRTKNNMQVICSMLRLKARFTKNQELTGILTEIENKISCMALVQQKLYDSNNLSYINLIEYIESLVQLIKESYASSLEGIVISVNGDVIKVLLDTAIPCGLIINELMTNTIKHAFPDTSKGNLDISLNLNETRELVLRVSDNGIGLRDDLNTVKSRGLGIQTILDLVEYQLDGVVNFENRDGLCCTIILKQELYEPRI